MTDRHTPTPKPRRRPDGTLGCAWCGGDIPRGRRSWCSQECVHQRYAQSRPRHYLEQRDHGVCSSCGLDTRACQKLAMRARRLCRWLARRHPLPHREADPLWRRWFERRFGRGLTAVLGRQSWWDADHILPLSEGGELSAANLRTLCRWCHLRETAALAARRAARRKGAP